MLAHWFFEKRNFLKISPDIFVLNFDPPIVPQPNLGIMTTTIWRWFHTIDSFSDQLFFKRRRLNNTLYIHKYMYSFIEIGIHIFLLQESCFKQNGTFTHKILAHTLQIFLLVFEREILKYFIYTFLDKNRTPYCGRIHP